MDDNRTVRSRRRNGDRPRSCLRGRDTDPDVDSAMICLIFAVITMLVTLVMVLIGAFHARFIDHGLIAAWSPDTVQSTINKCEVVQIGVAFSCIGCWEHWPARVGFVVAVSTIIYGVYQSFPK